MSKHEMKPQGNPKLAGYADGELSGTDTHILRQLLNNEVQARELDAQERFGPQNKDLWNATAPVMPTSEQWATVQANIRHRVAVGRVPGSGRFWTFCVVAAVAAVVLLGISLKPMPKLQVNPMSFAKDMSTEEVAALPTATADDVEVHAVREGGWLALLVGQSPLPGKMEWVKPNEITYLASSWPEEFFGPEPKLASNGTDAPVIFADDSR